MLTKRMWMGLGLMFAASGAYAETLNFNAPLNGGPAATVAMLDLTQNGANVDFRLTKLGAAGLGGSSFITQLLLSYTGSQLGSFTNTGSQTISGFSFSAGTNASYNFGSLGGIEVGFPTSNRQGSDRFMDNDVALWTLTNASVSSFLTPISGSGPDALGMMHVQGLPGSQSFKYVATLDGVTPPVPEASAWISMLAGLGVVGLVLARRNKVGAQRSRLPSAA